MGNRMGANVDALRMAMEKADLEIRNESQLHRDLLLANLDEVDKKFDDIDAKQHEAVNKLRASMETDVERLNSLLVEGNPAMKAQLQTLRVRISASEANDRKHYAQLVERIDALEERGLGPQVRPKNSQPNR
eukprot:SAG31_NODE_2086_length_6484_cov_23.518716_3_plen_132_part_00